MAGSKCTCPNCHVIFDADPQAGTITCPFCQAALPDETSSTCVQAEPPTTGRTLVPLMLAALLAGGLGLYFFQVSTRENAPAEAGQSTRSSESLADPVQSQNAAAGEQSVPLARPIFGAESANLTDLPVPDLAALSQLPPRTTPPGTLVRKSASSDLGERVNRAIDRGVAYLRQHGQTLALPCPYEGLLGLTLLECGVPRTDPLVQRIAESLRQQESRMEQTYILSTTIFFLDRLGEFQDALRIQTLAERLIAGQCEDGSWSYRCPGGAAFAALRNPAGLTQSPPAHWRHQGFLLQRPHFRNSAALAHWQNQQAHLKHPHRLHFHLRGDHSNTQFATLALWIAQRHGVSAATALSRVEEHFREIQEGSGSWRYLSTTGGNRDSNTCAGLLALAVGHGLGVGSGRHAHLQNQPSADEAITRALDFLGQKIAAARTDDYPGLDGRDDLYTLWSLERVAVIYNLQKIGPREWYPWAAQVLVNTQLANGSWRRSLETEVGTCFALLVLRRSNLALDLTRTLRGRIRVPGQQPVVLPKLTVQPKQARPALPKALAPGQPKTLPRPLQSGQPSGPALPSILASGQKTGVPLPVPLEKTPGPLQTIPLRNTARPSAGSNGTATPAPTGPAVNGSQSGGPMTPQG